MKYEVDRVDESVLTLDTYNSDLNLVIDASKYSAHPLTNEGFAFMWAGARATHGADKGKFCFEVKVVEHLDVSHLPADEPNPHVVRVGFSVDSTSMQLGEEPLSYGYGGTGKISTNCQFKDFGPSFTAGDVVTAACNYDADPVQIGFAKNGSFVGWAYRVNKADLKGKALFPHILTKNCSFSVNFGQQAEPFFKLPEAFKEFTFIGCLPVDQRVAGTRAPEKREDCEMIMMCGLPGAGKSVWAADYSVKNAHKKYNILGTNNIIDKMKVMGLPRKRNYHGRWDVLIQMATKCLNTMFSIGSKLRRNYILDQTNVYPTAQRRKMRNFDGFRRIAVVVVPSEAEYKRRCDKRDREEGKEIPDSAVLEMKANFKIPEENDLFEQIIFTDLQREDAEKLVIQYNDEGKAATGPSKKQFRSNEPSGFGDRKGNFGGYNQRENRGPPGGYGGNSGGYGGYGRDSMESGGGGYGGRPGGYDSGQDFYGQGDGGYGSPGGRGGYNGGRGGRSGFDSGRGGRGGYGGYDNDFGGRGSYDNGRGGGRGGYDSGRGGRGGYDGGRGGRGGYDSGRGGRGGYDSGRGFDNGRGGRGGRGGYDSRGGGRGGADSLRGGRGGYDSGRGGRGGYDGGSGGRGGYDSGRGGYDGGRGGYDSGGRGGYDSGRGGFDSSRGGRGSYDNNDRSIGGYESRGGYDSDRRGGRGGSDRGRGGRGSRGGYESRGGYDSRGGRGDYDSGKSGYGGGQDSYDSGYSGGYGSQASSNKSTYDSYGNSGSNSAGGDYGGYGGSSYPKSESTYSSGGYTGSSSRGGYESSSYDSYGKGGSSSSFPDSSRQTTQSSYGSASSYSGKDTQNDYYSGSYGYDSTSGYSSYGSAADSYSSGAGAYSAPQATKTDYSAPSTDTSTRYSQDSGSGYTGRTKASRWGAETQVPAAAPAAAPAAPAYSTPVSTTNYDYSKAAQPAAGIQGTQAYDYSQGVTQAWTAASASQASYTTGQAAAWPQYTQQAGSYPYYTQ